MTRRRRRWPWIVLALLIVVPTIEITLIVQVGRAIGGWQTFGLLILWSLVGLWIVRREWSRSFAGLTDALQTGRMPARELTDAGLALVGGVLLLAPGFLTDAIGLFLLLPFTRPLTRRLLEAAVARRILAGNAPVRTGYPQPGRGRAGRGPAGSSRPGGTAPEDDIIEGEIVEDD